MIGHYAERPESQVNYGGRWYELPNHPLLKAMRREPNRIDTLLREYLYDSSFPEKLEFYLKDYTDLYRPFAMFHMWHYNRPQWYYANSLIGAIILSRAFTLLSSPVRPPKSLSNPVDFPFSRLPPELRLQIYEHYVVDRAQRRRYWEVMTRVFIKALWSGQDAEEGARYITAILMLSCGCALSATPGLRGHGSKWELWDDTIADPESTWGWEKLMAAIMDTADLPRSSNPQLERLTSTNTLLSTTNSQVLHLAREHLSNDERDWTPPELVAKFLDQLYEGKDEAKTIWEDTGVVLLADEQRLGL